MTTRYRTPPPLGRRLAELRSRRYWTQQNLAQRSGLSQGLIQGIEQGVRPNPCLATVLKLAKALDVPLDELIQLDDLDGIEGKTGTLQETANP